VGTFSLPFADITGWRECCTSDLRPPRECLGKSPARFYMFASEIVMGRATARCNSFDIANDAERGLDGKEFFLVFQPKLRSQTGLLSGFESLLRWSHPKYGILMPSEFIAVVENSPLTCRFTDFILGESARTLADWADRGYGGLSLSINLPAREITENGMVKKLFSNLDEHAVQAERFQIELTESINPGPIDVLNDAVASIREVGISVAIDDFGAGCWSLSMLHRLAIDTVKLDGSFIRDIHKNSESRIVVEALISLGKRLGKRIVIEGVETEAQFEWLNTMPEIDCQGYYISEPVQESKIDGIIEKHGILVPRY
ncbi:EAL domain-containing protein, partial [Burkholderia ubonensis]|uniref:EAL domain-containing protein n=1 Tax=Burkholderia ubonensis TaxID=101571 RepID=UPI001E370681